HAPETEFAKAAETALARLDAAHPLTSDEQMTRGRAFAETRHVGESIAAFDRAALAPGRPITSIERCRAKGDALFHAGGKSLEAARQLTVCARTGGPHAAEDAFHAARALARADEDDQALLSLGAIEKQYPKTKWAEEAAFHIARLHMVHQRWREAA